MKWISSYGGPLICLESSSARLWGGTDKLSVPDDHSRNDYDRACSADVVMASVPLSDGSPALLFGTGSLDTSVWTAQSGTKHILSIEYCEAFEDVPRLLAKLDDALFEKPVRVNEVSFSTRQLCILDSAGSGEKSAEVLDAFALAPGRYRILSNYFEPDRRTSLLMHRFVLM